MVLRSLAALALIAWAVWALVWDHADASSTLLRRTHSAGGADADLGQLAGDYAAGLLRAQCIALVDSAGTPLLYLGSRSSPDGHGLALFDTSGTVFFRAWPGVLCLSYPKRKGSGTLLWVGPGFQQPAELQLVAPNGADDNGPALSLQVGPSRQGRIVLSDPEQGTTRTVSP
jgi:hypothetical protein